MKLELKHLSAYLPYKLKGIVTWDHLEKNYEVELYGIEKDNLIIQNPFGGHDYCTIQEFKPILRPLSDLHEAITHKGAHFLPIEHLGYGREYRVTFYEKGRYFYVYRDGVHVICPQGDMLDKLHEWHFDTFGLIENDLAININDLK